MEEVPVEGLTEKASPISPIAPPPLRREIAGRVL